MDLRDTPEEAAFRAEVRDWIEANLPQELVGQGRIRTQMEEPWREWSRKLSDAGYAGLTWPREYGGAGAPYSHQAIFYEEMARAEAPPHIGVIGLGMAGPTIIAHGTEAQKARYLAKILSAEEIWCQGFSEPDAGSDLAAVKTTATLNAAGDAFVVNGQKVWSSYAHIADWCLLVTRSDPEAPRYQNLTYLLVDMHSPGIEVRPLREITGEALFNEVFLDEVFVPDDCVVAEPGDGWRLARTTLANERVAMAGTRLSKSAERAVEIAASRELGPVERARIGHAVALATVCSLLGTRTTLRAIDGAGPGAESSVAKLLGVRSRQDAAELVVELQGDAAATIGDLAREGDVEADVWEMLNTRCLSIAGGTTQILRNVAGERILGLPR